MFKYLFIKKKYKYINFFILKIVKISLIDIKLEFLL